MPRKARYWADPEKHRLEQRQRRHLNSSLGFKGGLRNIATYNRWRAQNTIHARTNLKAKKGHREAVKRYRDKLKAAGFSGSSRDIYFYARLKGTLKDGYRRLPQYDAPEKAKLLEVRRGSSGKANGDPMPSNHHSKLINNLLRREPRKKRSPRAKRLRRR